jgi:hypothetical protein
VFPHGHARAWGSMFPSLRSWPLLVFATARDPSGPGVPCTFFRTSTSFAHEKRAEVSLPLLVSGDFPRNYEVFEKRRCVF